MLANVKIMLALIMAATAQQVTPQLAQLTFGAFLQGCAAKLQPAVLHMITVLLVFGLNMGLKFFTSCHVSLACAADQNAAAAASVVPK